MKFKIALAALGLSATALSVAGNSTKIIDKDVSKAFIKVTDVISCEDWTSWEGVETAIVRLDLQKHSENSHLSILSVNTLEADVAGKKCADINTAELVGPADEDFAPVELTRVVSKIVKVNTYLGCTNRDLTEDLSIKLHSGLVLKGRDWRTLGSVCNWN